MWMEFLQIFVRGNPMQKVADDFKEMYQTAHQMAKLVEPHIFDHTLPIDQRSHIYKLDVRVNKLERSIRKGVVAHLSLGRSDVPYGLLMMSLVKDVERIGDYSKSLIELKDVGFELEEGSARRNEACELHATIVPLFDQTLTALQESDADVARLVMNTHEGIKERTDQLLAAAVKGGGQGTGAMLYPLALRFLRRVSAHLSNIASSVGNPVDQISSDATSK